MVTLRDLSYISGYSLSTVSKALNGRLDVGEKTEKKIRIVADEMGYLSPADRRRGALGISVPGTERAEKRSRLCTELVGVLFCGDDENVRWYNHFFSAFRDRLEPKGISFLILSEKPAVRNKISVFAEAKRRGVGCVLILGELKGRDGEKLFSQEEIQVLMLKRSGPLYIMHERFQGITKKFRISADERAEKFGTEFADQMMMAINRQRLLS